MCRISTSTLLGPAISRLRLVPALPTKELGISELQRLGRFFDSLGIVMVPVQYGSGKPDYFLVGVDDFLGRGAFFLVDFGGGGCGGGAYRCTVKLGV